MPDLSEIVRFAGTWPPAVPELRQQSREPEQRYALHWPPRWRRPERIVVMPLNGHILYWFGGKWPIADWIASHFPPHRNYIEPYGGGASVLLCKEPARREIWNDLDDELLNLFQVLRDRALVADLERRLVLTPFSVAEYNFAYEETDDPVEKAARLVTRLGLGIGKSKAAQRKKTGFRRVNFARSVTHRVWASLPERIQPIVERLDSVVIESRPALDIIDFYDEPNALFYCDPPYFGEERTSDGTYAHELTEQDHIDLLDRLNAIQGRVVLSGFMSDLYSERLTDWHMATKQTKSNMGNVARLERLWMNFEPQMDMESLL